MKKFIQQVSKVALVVLSVMTFATAEAQIQNIPSPFGGNDNGSYQSFGNVNTVVGATAYTRGSQTLFTNVTITGVTNISTVGPLGSYVDVSAFDKATIVFSATNAYSVPATNVFTIVKGYGLGAVTSFETTPTLPTYTVIVPGNSFVLWTTNLTINDIPGVGFLQLNSLTNTSASSTNGYYAIGMTNVFGLSTNAAGQVTGTTNIVGYGVNIGVATKVLHSLR
jgi:hypothetical protein